MPHLEPKLQQITLHTVDKRTCRAAVTTQPGLTMLEQFETRSSEFKL
jgi:hypothetical protein